MLIFDPDADGKDSYKLYAFPTLMLTVAKMTSRTYPVIAKIGYRFPKLHQCEHSGYQAVDISNRLHPVWLDFFLQNEFAINELLRWSYVTAYEKGYDIRPKPEDVMNVFDMDPNAIRVVIVGQDPYPQEGVANGYAFATNQKTITSSLERLFSSIPGLHHSEGDYTLSGWRSQGVFLLNKTPILWTPAKIDYRELRKEQEQAGDYCGPKLTHPPDNCSIEMLEAIMKQNEAITEAWRKERKPAKPELEEADVNLLMTKWAGITRNVCLFILSIKKAQFVLMGEKAKTLKTDLKTAILCSHPSGRNVYDTFDGKCFSQIPSIDWSRA